MPEWKRVTRVPTEPSKNKVTTGPAPTVDDFGLGQLGTDRPSETTLPALREAVHPGTLSRRIMVPDPNPDNLRRRQEAARRQYTKEGSPYDKFGKSKDLVVVGGGSSGAKNILMTVLMPSVLPIHDRHGSRPGEKLLILDISGENASDPFMEEAIKAGVAIKPWTVSPRGTIQGLNPEQIAKVIADSDPRRVSKDTSLDTSADQLLLRRICSTLEVHKGRTGNQGATLDQIHSALAVLQKNEDQNGDQPTLSRELRRDLRNILQGDQGELFKRTSHDLYTRIGLLGVDQPVVETEEDSKSFDFRRSSVLIMKVPNTGVNAFSTEAGMAFQSVLVKVFGGQDIGPEGAGFRDFTRVAILGGNNVPDSDLARLTGRLRSGGISTLVHMSKLTGEDSEKIVNGADSLGVMHVTGEQDAEILAKILNRKSMQVTAVHGRIPLRISPRAIHGLQHKPDEMFYVASNRSDGTLDLSKFNVPDTSSGGSGRNWQSGGPGISPAQIVESLGKLSHIAREVTREAIQVATEKPEISLRDGIIEGAHSLTAGARRALDRAQGLRALGRPIEDQK